MKPTTALDVTSVEDAAKHLSTLVAGLRERARRVESANGWLLFGIIFVLLASIVIFWRADSIATNFVGDALKAALQRRDALLQKIQATESALPNAQRDLILLEEARKGLAPLNTLLSRMEEFFKSHGNETDPVSEADREKIINRLQWRITNVTATEARKVFAAIQNGTAPVVVDFRGRFSLNATMLDKLQGIATTYGLHPTDVVQQLDQITSEGAKLDRLLPGEQEIMPQMANIEEAYRQLKRPGDDAWQSLNEQIEAAQRTTIIEGSKQTTEQLNRLRGDLRKIDDQIDELEDRQRSWASLAWIPSFSVRAGSVVLALFLVSFFISLYRYNTLVAGFYNSRADVLQVVAPNKSKDWIDLNEVTVLIKSFSSEGMEFLVPAAPYSAFLDSLKLKPPSRS